MGCPIEARILETGPRIVPRKIAVGRAVKVRATTASRQKHVEFIALHQLLNLEARMGSEGMTPRRKKGQIRA